MARRTTEQIAREHLARGDATGWFEEVYRNAAGDERIVPWADGTPHVLLQDWLKTHPAPQGRGLDVGCGLGENAELLSICGLDMTAFDISPTAIEWARTRNPNSPVDYRAEDLFNLPESWNGRFDFINEIYTLQALHDSVRKQAFAPLARLLAPGGQMLVICRGRASHEPPEGPPWALSKDEIMRFETLGLTCTQFERFGAYGDDGWSRFRLVFTA